MNRLLFAVAAAATLLTGATAEPALSQVRVVATTPDLAALATAIGGRGVEVTALAKPTEDPHFVDARPSLIVTLNRADMLIEGGAELELGWLPPLVQSARNAKIAVGAPGRLSASQGITLLNVPTTFDRSQGDVHALGNPHFLLDPENVRTIASEITSRLSRLDPASADLYATNLRSFESTLDSKLTEWEGRLAPHAGAAIVTYHNDFLYLAARFRLNVVTTLEPKPGISPSPAHIAEVISTMRAAGARVILVQPFQNRRTAETVARQANAVVLDLPQQPGVVPNTESYFDLMDHIVDTLATALAATR